MKKSNKDINNSGYKEAISKVIKVRIDRKKVYGDSWKDMKEYELVAHIKQKTNRLEYIFLNGLNDYEKSEDTLIDLANYALFLLQLKIEGAKK